MRRVVVWSADDRVGTEHCVLRSEPGGFRFDGIVVTHDEQSPLLVEYAVRVDVAWRTRRIEMKVNGGGGVHTAIFLADGYGGWWREGVALPELQGCLDVDLAISPSTKALPVRRLLLQEGQSRDVPVAWVRASARGGGEVDVELAPARYARVGTHAYEHALHGESTILDVDDDGLPLRAFGFRSIARA